MTLKAWHILFSFSRCVSCCFFFCIHTSGRMREFHRNFSSFIKFLFWLSSINLVAIFFLKFCCTVFYLLLIEWTDGALYFAINSENSVWCSSDELNSYIGQHFFLIGICALPHSQKFICLLHHSLSTLIATQQKLITLHTSQYEPKNPNHPSGVDKCPKIENKWKKFGVTG